MERRVAVAKLVEIANILDEQNMAQEADIVTRFAMEMMAPPMDFNPDDAAADYLFAQDDEYENNQKMMKELAVQEALDRLMQINAMKAPSKEALADYDAIVNFINSLPPDEIASMMGN